MTICDKINCLGEREYFASYIDNRYSLCAIDYINSFAARKKFSMVVAYIECFMTLLRVSKKKVNLSGSLSAPINNTSKILYFPLLMLMLSGRGSYFLCSETSQSRKIKENETFEFLMENPRHSKSYFPSNDFWHFIGKLWRKLENLPSMKI